MQFTLSGGTLNISFDYLMQYDTESISALTENGIVYSEEINTGLTYTQGDFYRYSKDNRVYLCTENLTGSSINLTDETSYFKRSSVLESLCNNNIIQMQLFNVTDDIVYNTYDLIKISILSNYVFSITQNTGIRLTSNSYSSELVNEFVYSLNSDVINQYNSEWFYSPWESFNISITNDDLNSYSGKTFELRLVINNFKCLPNILLDNISIKESVNLIVKELTNHTSNIGFQLTKTIDNIKSHVGENKLILNSKELDLNLDINSLLEKNILTYILDNRVDFNTLININLDFNTEADLLLYLKNNHVSLCNRKTVRSYYFIGELYKLYYRSLIENNVTNGYTFEQLNTFVKKINNKWQHFIEQLLPATTIINSLNLINNNFFNQTNKFRYKKYNLNYTTSGNVYYNDRLSQSFTKTTCSQGIGETMDYVVTENKYSSVISKEAANQLAQEEINNNGQNYVNAYGNCYFYNVQISDTFIKNDCDVEAISGSSVTYTVIAGKYMSNTQENANNLALEEILENGQIFANNNGICIFGNDTISSGFTKNNCQTYYSGTSITYSVLENRYTGTTKQIANNLAIADISANGQNYANTNGSCIELVYWNTEITSGFTKNDCESGTGTSVNYTVLANSYSAHTQEIANNLAKNEIYLSGQTYANNNGTCTSLAYYNIEMSSGFTKNNCSSGYSGTTLTYVVSANTYTGNTQEAANNLAIADISANGQTYANTHGTCTQSVFWNIEQSSGFTKNDCSSGGTGTSVTYTVAAHTYSGSTQEIANNLALNDVNTNGQAYANTNGTCSSTLSFVVNDFSVFEYSGTPQTINFVADPDNTVSCLSKPTWITGVTIDNNANTISFTPSYNEAAYINTGFTEFHCNNNAPNIIKYITQNYRIIPFIPNIEFNGVISTMAELTNNNIIVGGNFTQQSNAGNSITSLLENGNKNMGFAMGSAFNGHVTDLFSQSDNKIVIGGLFTLYNGTPCNRITRLNSNGTIDSGFTIGNGFDSEVYSVTQQTDNKILVTGAFSNYNGVTCKNIARLNSDGTIDMTFSSGNGVGSNDSAFLRAVPLSGGSILLTGSFYYYNGTYTGPIVKLLNNGSIDTSFTNGINGTVMYALQLTDGKILIGGDFTKDGLDIGRLFRLNINGTIDTSFNNGGIGPNQMPMVIKLQSDGKIIIGGSFTAYNNIYSGYAARLNSDGTLDNSFIKGTGFDSTVYGIYVQNDGKILFGGNFNSYNGQTIGRLARLYPDGNINISL